VTNFIKAFAGLMLLLSIGISLCLTMPAHAQDVLTPTPTLTDAQVLAQAAQIVDEANISSQNAMGVVTNANSAVTTSNRTLIIAAGAMTIGGVLVLLIAGLAMMSAVRTINETSRELAKARLQTTVMRNEFKTNIEQVRTTVAHSLQALSAMQLGEQQLRRNNIKGAIQVYRKAYALDPQNLSLNYFLGEAYVQDSQIEKGIEHLEQVLSTHADYAPTEAALGLALRIQGDQNADSGAQAMLYVQAEAHLLRALQLDPTIHDLHGKPIQAVLGSLYKRQGRTEQAIARYEEAYKIAPQLSYLLVNIAILYFVRGDLTKAQGFARQIEANTSAVFTWDALDYWAQLDHLIALVILGETEAALHDIDLIPSESKVVEALKLTLDELHRLKNTPQPPNRINEIIERINMLVPRQTAQ